LGEQRRKKLPAMGKTAVVTADIVAGLLDKHPLPRYRSGIDCKFGVPIALWLPDRVRDVVLAM